MDTGNRNTEKVRKSEQQKDSDAADNAGLFAGSNQSDKSGQNKVTATVRADETRPRMDMYNDINRDDNDTKGRG